MPHEDEEKPKNENLPPGVISIKPPPRFGMFGSMMIRFGLGGLLLAAGVLAVYYSIEVHSDNDKGSGEGTTPIEKTYFTLNRTQYCLTGGILTRENHTGYDAQGNHLHQTTKIATQWAQMVEGKRLFFSVGIPHAADWEKSYFVFPNYTIIASPNGPCIKEPKWGYDDFLTFFGLENLFYIRSEQIILNDEEEGGEEKKSADKSAEKEGDEKNFIDVNFFQGNPAANGAYKFSDSIPFLGIGYMDSTNSKAIAWQMYFEEDPKNVNNSRYFEEFWFPEMQNGVPTADVFSLPEYCVP